MTINMNHHTIKLKDNCVTPECLLEFTKTVVVSPKGCLSYILQLSCSSQMLCFSEASYLVGKNLTYVIPKYFCHDGELYEIQTPSPPISNDILIQNVNCLPVTPTLTTIPSACAYFLSISVTTDLLNDDCQLILEFIKFNLKLTKVIKKNNICDKLKSKCESKYNWKWINSIDTLIECDDCDDNTSISTSKCSDDQSVTTVLSNCESRSLNNIQMCNHNHSTKSHFACVCRYPPQINPIYYKCLPPKQSTFKHWGNLQYIYNTNKYRY